MITCLKKQKQKPCMIEDGQPAIEIKENPLII